MKPSLETTLAGVKLRNPTILAAGVLGTTGKSLKRVAKEGAGAVTTKSLGIRPKEGHSNPTIMEMEGGLINAMGLPNPGVDNFLDELVIAKEGGAPVIASIFGGTVEEFAEVAKKIWAGKPDMVEVNISCPNVKEGMSFGSSPELAAEATDAVKKAVKCPVIVKLTPNTDKLLLVAKAVEDSGADVISAINSIGPGMVIDAETGKPFLSNQVGGLSGPMIKPVALRCVYDISSHVEIPVIGIGGIETGLDAAEMLMAGASAVGVGTAVYSRGIEVFSKICEELEYFMAAKSYKSTKDLVGLTRR